MSQRARMIVQVECLERRILLDVQTLLPATHSPAAGHLPAPVADVADAPAVPEPAAAAPSSSGQSPGPAAFNRPAESQESRPAEDSNADESEL